MKTLFSKGRFSEALPFAERAVAMREAALGTEHPDSVTAINYVAELYVRERWYAKAEPLLLRVLRARERFLGAMHPDVAISLGNLADVYQAQGEYEKAETLYGRVLDIYHLDLGAIHPDVATSMNNLAVVLQAQGDYVSAKPLYVRALEMREETLGATHPDVANSLNNLATLYDAQGEYAKAEPLYHRALAIREKATIALPVSVTSTSNAEVSDTFYWVRGAYIDAKVSAAHERDKETRSLPFYETPLFAPGLSVGTSVSKTWRRSGWPTSLTMVPRTGQPSGSAEGSAASSTTAVHQEGVATALNNFALHYEARGEYAKAEPLLVRAREIRERILGTTHPGVATSLANLGRLYEAQGAHDKAEPLLLRALAIREAALGTAHPDVATSLDGLALLRWREHRYADAERLCSRALRIREKVLGATHPDLARSLDNLALLSWTQGAAAKAEQLWNRSLEIRERVLGATHPEVAHSLNNLGMLYRAQGRLERAESLWLRAIDIRETTLDASHPDTAQSLVNLAMVYQAQRLPEKAERLLRRAAAIREAQLRRELPRLSESRKRLLMMRLQRETDQVVSLHVDAMPNSPNALDLALTTILRRKGRVLDSLADNQAMLRAHLTPALRDKLDKLSALNVELSTHLREMQHSRRALKRNSFASRLRTRIEQLESELNAASHGPGIQAEPVTIEKIRDELPRGAALVEFIRYHRFDGRQSDPWKEEHYVAYILARQGRAKAVDLGTAGAIDAAVDAVLSSMHRSVPVDRTNAALEQLDRLIYAPLRPHFKGISHLILSPDAKLNLVPFEAMISSQGQYEIERRLLSYVTSGRDLLRFAVRREPRSAAAIVAAPDYDMPHATRRSRIGTFLPLEGAVAEADELPAYFAQARTLTGRQATRSALGALVGPAVLHVATHGFYAHSVVPGVVGAPRPPAVIALPPAITSPNARGIYVGHDSFPGSLEPASIEDPREALDRAGLAMAGANFDAEGIVSARDLAGFDWWGTQLVVLSACETGVGAVPSGEGVYGMRRALALAGTESQVVSLWNVNDSSTRELMRTFYGELSRGTGPAEALRRAKLQLRLRREFAHPYYWAAFIPAGNWTPINPYSLGS